jgi:hypothetical protein
MHIDVVYKALFVSRCSGESRGGIVIIIIIIIMKSSIGRDNNYCHYIIPRSAGFAIMCCKRRFTCKVDRMRENCDGYYNPQNLSPRSHHTSCRLLL